MMLSCLLHLSNSRGLERKSGPGLEFDYLRNLWGIFSVFVLRTTPCGTCLTRCLQLAQNIDPIPFL